MNSKPFDEEVRFYALQSINTYLNLCNCESPAEYSRVINELIEVASAAKAVLTFEPKQGNKPDLNWQLSFSELMAINHEFIEIQQHKNNGVQ